MLESPGFLFTILAFLLVLGPLVFVHEYGHYIVGRWCGVKAETFSIGFGRKILGWTDKRGTEWKLGWLPLGGYVQFAGDRDAVSQPDADWQALPEAERAHTFPAQPVWKRALIVLAGPVTNFLFAILILAGFAWLGGVATNPAVVGTVQAGSAADAAGLRPGDHILSIDGR
ncbi:MAG TPA: site-2 protease family protein, partial [Sphingopyxis sp.]|nr:site-2 protease family protein [Sphingopyxis sp.]